MAGREGMRFNLRMILGLTWLVTCVLVPVTGQESNGTDWPGHDLDLADTRFSPLDQINASNAGALTKAWSFQVARSVHRPANATRRQRRDVFQFRNQTLRHRCGDGTRGLDRTGTATAIPYG